MERRGEVRLAKVDRVRSDGLRSDAERNEGARSEGRRDGSDRRRVTGRANKILCVFAKP